MRKLLSIVALGLILSGCSAFTRPTYSKPGNTQQQFAADQSYCNALARPFNDGGMMGLASFIQQKDMCMAGKGYTKGDTTNAKAPLQQEDLPLQQEDLWRATIDTLSFMPKVSADREKGVITTSWYEDKNVKGERFKVKATMSKETPSEINITVSKEKLDDIGAWHKIEDDPSLAQRLKDTIQSRARQIADSKG
jgi:hypothetical protein